MDANERQSGNRIGSERQDGGNTVDPRSLPVSQRINLLVRALNGAERTNEALARCSDGEAMLDVLLTASSKLGLGLTREQLANTPPIRDWVWWKNKEALLTIGDNKPRYQQDGGQGRSEAAEPGRRRFFGLF
jgi:hypothetical protein